MIKIKVYIIVWLQCQVFSVNLKFRRTKQSSQLLLISSLFASSALISNVAHAETQSVNQNPKSDSSLIQAIGNDPMIVAPSQKVQQLKTGESAIINQINQELISHPTKKTAEGVSSVSQLSDVRPTD
ncbi:MAG: hypothetical protein ACK5VA_02985 [Pseudanabaena sp.]|jgi:phosphoenolpyruvate-protein kinase (PTS system EI component)|nr:hypothetical protein [Pseudanabaena sp. M090S1SP2A07QC]MCA6507371.1 hypothetical protein [Pseudanabaena sp. M172S2SP2A07QC]MCA6520344.1 hypothetical protein [Pseudanabaena sp. M051S1SP2A07QC]MCA6525343.1 hypothetical protein [Pseudanabaena sp. M179S2SP2A07QC]MCA6528735.1 hypothetical protein [Pseudanabaena sp. M125S2SP2A07QC]MCA6536350.1 hypothetical protein [Pseudanabaena sp. M176S2SP2A07QC]MCA6539176.1 hypothetical protein [Pseudanabaena sp. M037S2SP2A07QC]MCA6544532.1 hypothetical prot